MLETSSNIRLLLLGTARTVTRMSSCKICTLDCIQVWFSNVPHARLAEDKGGQNWISIDKDKFKFPGGGTQFIHGADKYLDQIEQVCSCYRLYCYQMVSMN